MGQQTFLFFGTSGAGKGTQARLMKEYLEKNSNRPVLYIETGEHLREFARRKTYSGELTGNILENGGLMPSFVPIWIWSTFLLENFTGEEHIITDGLSRRIMEAPVLNSAIDFYGIKNCYVVFLNVSRERAFSFMKKRGRADDTDEHINNRLDWFEAQVMPSVEYFRNETDRNFLDIDGEQSIKDVHKDILKKAGLIS